jgi:hypothetical protein
MLFALWAQLTPLGSAPDEASHLMDGPTKVRPVLLTLSLSLMAKLWIVQPRTWFAMM